MNRPNFPLELYTRSLVKFLDTIDYHDDNYDHSERLHTLRHVYSETAKHFAQPVKQDGLTANPKKMAAVMQTGVQTVVYCWVKVPLDVMVAISIYFVYIILLDDSDDDPRSKMDSFSGDLLRGKEQKHPFWRLINEHLLDFLPHYGSFCGLAVIRSTFDYFQGCWIETQFPGFLRLRRLSSLSLTAERHWWRMRCQLFPHRKIR